MKKILGGLAFGLIAGFIVVSIMLGGGTKSSANKDAITTVKMYEMKNSTGSLGESTIGMSLSVYVEKYVLQLMKSGRMVSNGSWSSEDNRDYSGYIVSYKFKLGGEENVFQWEVKGNTITAKNGKAKSATPELDPTR